MRNVELNLFFVVVVVVVVGFFFSLNVHKMYHKIGEHYIGTKMKRKWPSPTKIPEFSVISVDRGNVLVMN